MNFCIVACDYLTETGLCCIDFICSNPLYSGSIGFWVGFDAVSSMSNQRSKSEICKIHDCVYLHFNRGDALLGSVNC